MWPATAKLSHQGGLPGTAFPGGTKPPAARRHANRQRITLSLKASRLNAGALGSLVGKYWAMPELESTRD